jgi:hypothetical protein
VIDVRTIDEAMQRGVDARGTRIQIEGAVRVQRHEYGVVIRSRLVELLEREKLLHI